MTLEQLGYICSVDEYDDLVCEIQEGKATYYVDFHTESKSFETYGYVKGVNINHPINIELYTVITLKLKELGWI